MDHPIYPCLWFDGRAQEAAEYYCSVFKQSRIISTSAMVVMFELNGRKMMGLNGGPQFTFTESVSFVIECDTQEEIDHYWTKLTEGGTPSMCGWLKDRFGVSWQVIPSILPKLMSDPQKAPRVVELFLKMSKFNIETLENA